MSTGNIEIDAKRVKRTRSPLYWVVGTLQGAAMTFAPLGLYAAGKGWFHEYGYLVAALCLRSRKL
jgi:hypothetical protein